jgi:hypothetical protein
MKKLTATLFILVVFLQLSAQDEDKYKSKEQDNYYKDVHYTPFAPLDKQKILDFKSEYYQINEIADFSPYDKTRFFNPYQDSVNTEFYKQYKNKINYIPKLDRVGKIDKIRILKYEKNRDREAFIYLDSKFENIYFGEPGIWLAYKENKQTEWKYYYTGIVQNQPVNVKWYSKLPLILENHTFQIEASLLRQTEPFSHPGPGPDYEVIKDGLAIVFDLNMLSKDSDKDGLTDILEAKLHTNPDNIDTDNDGIPDNVDLNPRFNLKRTEKTLVYEALLNNDISFKSFLKVPKIIENPRKSLANDSTETIMIVTDDPELLAVEPKKQRVIFLTKKEYEQSKGIFKTELNEMSISPMFKIDNLKNAYIVSRDFNTWGEEYLVIRTKKGWKIQVISSSIS